MHLETFLPPAALEPPGLGSRAETKLADFAAMLEKWIAQNRSDRYASVAELLDAILHDSGYVDALRDGTEDGEERFANLQELRGVAAQYMPGMAGMPEDQTPLALFLEEVSLVSEVDDFDAESGAVTLLTLHTAKGLEFPVVFMVGLEDGILPHNRSIESGDEEEMDEERRLCYVGITRAKKRLYLVHAFQRSLWGRSEPQEPSRFLDEIPAQLLSGMVSQQSRRQNAYTRMVSWDKDEGWSQATPGRGAGSRRGSTERGKGSAAGQPASTTYWSPGSEARPRARRRASRLQTPRSSLSTVTACNMPSSAWAR